MKYIKIPFLLIWRLWFYVLMFATIILMFPALAILSSDEKWYGKFWKLIRGWSHVLIYGMGFHLKVEKEEETDKEKSYMFCANHGSFMDPFVLIAMTKNPIVFVGKKELVKIPIFGYIYKRVVIMVDRGNPASRKRVFEMAKKRLQNGTSIGIFPEGLVPTEDVVLAPFKNGAFSLAIEHQIPIVPASYYDCKRFFSWDFFKGRPGVFRVRQHQFIETKDMTLEDLANLKVKTFDLLHSDLLKDKAYMKDTNRKENKR